MILNKTRMECHVHTEYSNIRLVDAINKPEALIDRAIELGLAGIAITDHESLSGSIRINQYAKKIKETHPDFKIAIGNEIYLVDERPSEKHWHFILVAKDAVGHKQLRYLSSLAWMNSYYAKGLERVDTLKSDLEKIVLSNPGHIIASSACLGSEIDQAILALTKAEKVNDEVGRVAAHNSIVNMILWCKKVFGEDFYLECQPACSKEQIIVNRRMLSIAQCFNIKMIVTCDAHYLTKNDRYIHKAFLNSKQGEREVDAFYEYTYLQSNDEIKEHLKSCDYDELFVEHLFENSLEIYNKIEFYDLEHPQGIPSVEVPHYEKKITNASFNEKYPELSRLYNSDDEIEKYWVNECVNKLNDYCQKKNKDSDIYMAELEEEAEVKTIVGNRLGTNMFAYPVTLQHYIDMIWECGSIIGAGRGSACSALNHYLLGITQLDPLEWNFPFFRYMNRDTAGLGDIDIDVQPSKRPLIMKEIKRERSHNISKDYDDLTKAELGCTYVATFGTESSKSAIQTAARGYRSEEFPDGIDSDISKYLSSLIPSDRGFVRTLKQVVYGDEDKGYKPISSFVAEIEQYPGLLEIAMGIEGLISRRGIHASGIIMFDEDPYDKACFMRAPNGSITTQYDLHADEAAGMTKFDLLVTEVCDRLGQTLLIMQEKGLFDKNLSLRELYNQTLHPSILDIEDKDVWKSIQEANVYAMFQLDSAVGRQGAKAIKPTNMWELSNTNALIRLMAEEGEERPMDKYIRFRKAPTLWELEMDKYDLTEEERAAMHEYLDVSSGVGLSQEQLMKVLMDARLCNFSLAEANKARKTVSKKKFKEIAALKDKVFSHARNEKLGQYIWTSVVQPQLGYAFSEIHSLSYSYIGYQTAYVSTHWNSVYWNTACLMVDAGALDSEENDKEKGTDYAKVAKAIGMMKSQGIEVSLVDINESALGFEADDKNNRILFGLKGLSKVNEENVEKIIRGRPYSGIKDFMNRCPLTKTVMLSLIKGGAFDKVDYEWASKICSEPRIAIMAYYISIACEPKKRLTLQNLGGLIKANFIPDEFIEQKKVFEFNKYLKDKKIKTDYYLDEPSYSFYSKHFDMDKITLNENGQSVISQKEWEKIYKSEMDKIKKWLIEHHDEVLKNYNTMLFNEMWKKYCENSLAAWEMEACCFYYHPHELLNINKNKYGLSDFMRLPETPEVEYYFKRGGRDIPIYKLTRIVGTVLNKDDIRSSISLLTIDGVITVKFTKEYYANYKKRISKVNPDGTKTVVEDGWFKRGNKVMITGFRREDTFVAKSYTNTPTHQLYMITSISKDGTEMELEHDRADA